MWERAIGIVPNACRTDVADLSEVDLAKLEKGMTWIEVLEMIGQPDSRTATTFGYCLTEDRTASAIFTPGGELESWQLGDIATVLTLDGGNPTAGQVTDPVSFEATLNDADGLPVANQEVTFSVGGATATAATDDMGRVVATITLQGPAERTRVSVDFAGAPGLIASSASASFKVAREVTRLQLGEASGTASTPAEARAQLREEDGAALTGKEISFYILERVNGRIVPRFVGTAVTDAEGIAFLSVPVNDGPKDKGLVARFEGDGDFLGSIGLAKLTRR